MVSLRKYPSSTFPLKYPYHPLSTQSSPKLLATISLLLNPTARDLFWSPLEPTHRLKEPKHASTPPQQGSLHYTPEHCLVNGGLPLFWWKSHVFKEPANLQLLFSTLSKILLVSGKSNKPWLVWTRVLLERSQNIPAKTPNVGVSQSWGPIPPGRCCFLSVSVEQISPSRVPKILIPPNK